MKIVPLIVSSLTKTYGTQAVLKDVSLSLKPGEIFGLIGLNGVGKTTMIKIILDLLNADKGEVALFGIPAQQARSRAALCYLPEKFVPSPYLKGVEFLTLAAAYYGKKPTLAEMEAVACALGLAPEALKRRVGGYSKGMGQKIGLCSALLSEAPLLILDEPMSGLDPKARVYLKRALKTYARKGNTVFFSSHILADMEEICDRIAVLHNAGIVFSGTPNAFKAKHHSKGVTLEEAFLNALETAST